MPARPIARAPLARPMRCPADRPLHLPTLDALPACRASPLSQRSSSGVPFLTLPPQRAAREDARHRNTARSHPDDHPDPHP
jgi:hypothetical protein